MDSELGTTIRCCLGS